MVGAVVWSNESCVGFTGIAYDVYCKNMNDIGMQRWWAELCPRVMRLVVNEPLASYCI